MAARHPKRKLELPVTLNLDLPRLRKRADHEIAKLSGSTEAKLPAIQLPPIGIAGTIDTARKVIGDARRSLTEGGDQVAVQAKDVAKRASAVPQDVRRTVDDLRSLRITREKRRRDPWPGVALIAGVIGGIAAMFLFDPTDGKRRRTMLRDKLAKWGRQASQTAQGRATDLRNRSQGLIHEVRSAMPARETDDDAPVIEAQPDWASQEAVGVAAGGDTTADYSDMSHQPGTSNGREY
jgi:gas vesicle protein